MDMDMDMSRDISPIAFSAGAMDGGPHCLEGEESVCTSAATEGVVNGEISICIPQIEKLLKERLGDDELLEFNEQLIANIRIRDILASGDSGWPSNISDAMGRGEFTNRTSN